MSENRSQEKEIEGLVWRLTMEEKIQLLGGWPGDEDKKEGCVYGVPMLGIRPLKFADGPVGVHWWTKASTAYPALICLAASFDAGAAYRYGSALGLDCRARGIHVLLAPGVNLYRSSFCGRNFEYLGEDPELSAAMAVGYIRGVQDRGVCATVKHLALNNQEYDRNRVSSDADERTLREVYLRPFEAAVREGHVGAVMTSYNLVNGQHCAEHEWLLQTILRKEWNFEGLIMSDWVSTYSTCGSANAGLDLEMPEGVVFNEKAITQALRNGTISKETINEKIRHRLRLMARFGWLDAGHEQKDASIPDRNPETEAVAIDIARAGIVLLKNEAGALPLRANRVKRIAVLGYHAGHPVTCGGGSAYVPPHATTTLVEGLRKVYGAEVEIDYHMAVYPWREKIAAESARFLTPCGEPGLLGEYFNNPDFEGAPVVARVDAKIDFEWRADGPDPSVVTERYYSVRWRGKVKVERTGTYAFYLRLGHAVSRLIVGGTKLRDSFDTRTSAPGRFLVELSAGEEQEILMEFRNAGAGWVHCRLGYEWAGNSLDHYEEALAAAKTADAVVVGAGFNNNNEGEGFDREFGLDEDQNRLIRDAAAANPHTVVALYAGGAVDVAPWIDAIEGLLMVWYPGQDGALAAAEIIAGTICPQGRLPFTWEKKPEDRSSFDCYHDDDHDLRVSYTDGVFTGYRHFDRENIIPRYPFGFGLSYTTFGYENLRLDSMVRGEPLEIRFDLINTGKVAGAEAALVFVSDVESSLPRPDKQLEGFAKVTLEPGERRTVSVTLPPRAFAFFHSDRKQWVIEPGAFRVQIGASARDIRLEQCIEVHKGPTL